jgi:hypothetical protein
VSDISLDALLAEVARRQRVLGQLSVVLGADTAAWSRPATGWWSRMIS